jgi:serine/threonine protein kinase
MPFNTSQPAYQSLRNIVSERTEPVVYWCGAGLSQPAGLPSWATLRQILTDALKRKSETLEDVERQSLVRHAENIDAIADPWLAFERLKETLKEATFNDLVTEALAAAARVTAPKNYGRLWQLRPSGILNLNLDRLATQAAVSIEGFAPPIEFSGFQAGEYLYTLRTSARPFIANLHGIYENRGSWVLTRSQLRALLSTGGYKDFIRSCFASKTVVFIGVSADDVAAGGLLEDLRDVAKGTGSHFWITHRNDALSDSWAEAAGIRVIRYGPENDHAELGELLDDLRNYVPRDTRADPVVSSHKASAEPLPSPQNLTGREANDIRELLNSRAKAILSDHSQVAYDTFDRFCAEYDEAIYRAWYVSTDPGRNRLFNYVLENRLAAGAFGKVYRALAPDDTIVAIKVLHEEIRRKAESLQSFRRGVRSMQILNEHALQGVVRFLDASEIPAVVVMEYVPGPTLSEAVHATQVDTWQDILEIAKKLALVIDQAHSLPERVLHRDLRPNNVMLRHFYDEPGLLDVRVLDFDLSWHKDAFEKSVVHGAAPTGYLAPEQLTNVPGVTTRHAAVDSFGLGMTLFFMVSGRDPFPAEHQHRNWVKTLYEAVAHRTCREWQSLPYRFARLIQNATQDRQSARWDFYQIIAELENLSSALLRPHEVQSAEMIAEEVATRSQQNFTWNPERLQSGLSLPSGVRVAVAAEDNDRLIRTTIVWESTGVQEHKRVGKWLPSALEGAAAALSGGGWQCGRSLSGQRGEITGTLSPEAASRNIVRLAAALDAAIGRLRFD